MAYSVSQDFRTKCYSGESLYNCRLIIGEETIPVTQISSITISSPIIDDQKETFYIGTFISQKLTIKFKNLDGIDTTSGTNVELYISQYVNNSWEEVPIGKYIIDESPENYHQTAEIECFDYAIKFATNLDYSPCFVDDKTTIDNLLQWICTHYGVTLGDYPDTNGDVEIGTYDSTVSGKQWISYIAEIKGCNAKIDRLGRLTLVPLKSSPVVTVDALKSKSWELGEKFEVSQVVFFDAIRNYTFGDDSENTLYLRQDNPFVINEQVARNVYEKLRLAAEEVEQGESFSIEDTVEGEPIQDFAMYGDTTQESSPTPSTPQPINVVSGDNTINICGKNIYNATKEEETAYTLTYSGDTSKIYLNGTPTNSGRIFFNKTYLKAGTYTFSLEIASGSLSGGDTYFYLYKGTETTQSWSYRRLLLTTSGTRVSTTFTNLDDSYYYLSWYLSTNITFTNAQIRYQVEKGSSFTSFEAYTGNTYEINLGKNLFNTQTLNTTWRTTIVSSTNNEVVLKPSNGGGSGYVGYTIKALPSTTYTFSCNITLENYESFNGLIYIYEYNASNTQHYITNINSSSLTKTFTTQSDTTKLLINIYSYSGTTSNWEEVQATYSNIQLEKGSQTTYSPYKTPIELCKIVDYQDFIRKGTGKNLFDKDNANILNCYISSLTGKLVEDNNPSILYVACKTNTTYTISRNKLGSYFSVAYTNVQPAIDVQTYGKIDNNTGESITITTGQQAQYLIVRYYYGGDTGTPASFRELIQIEENNQSTLFEPYGFGGIWYLHKEIEKVTLDGSEYWQYYTATGKPVFYMDTSTSTKMSVYLQKSGLICYGNYYQGKGQVASFDDVYNLGNNVVAFRTSFARLVIRNDSITDTTDFKTWLSTHNTIVYYVLSTPTDTPIEDSELLEQLESIEEEATFYGGVTNITSTSPITFKKLTSDPFICYSLTTENYGDISLDAWDTIHYTLGDEDYYTLNNNSVEYAMTIMSKVETKIPTKQQEVTTNVVGGNDEVKIRRLSTEVNTLDNRVTIQAEEIDENRQDISTLNVTTSSIQATVTSSTNSLSTQINALADSTSLQINAISTQLEDGVEKLTNSLVTIDTNGIKTSKENETFNTQITNKTFEVKDRDKELAFIGYDTTLNKTIARIPELEARQITAGVHRCETITRNGNKRTAWFYVGGDN